MDTEQTHLIDAQGKSARQAIRQTELKPFAAHLDWGVKNIRFRDDAVCAVYDWDSLHSASEAECVGRAAAQFTAQWEIPARLTPTPDEARAFVEEYQTARGRRFSRVEYAVAAASAHYLVAQVARLELLSGVPEGDDFRGLLRTYDSTPLL